LSVDALAEAGRRPIPLTGVVGPNKLRIIVRDVAYATYRAVLYYVYTNTIVFAPLSSSFLIASTTPQPTESIPVAPGTENQANLAYSQRTGHRLTGASGEPADSPRSRREWIAQWEKRNGYGKPRPCSAKAVYRLADRYDIQKLKQRALQHIIKSLTVENIAYEIFSAFTTTYEDVRKVWCQVLIHDSEPGRRKPHSLRISVLVMCRFKSAFSWTTGARSEDRTLCGTSCSKSDRGDTQASRKSGVLSR